MEVGRDTFALYIEDLGNLHLDGMPFLFSLYYYIYFYYYLCTSNLILFLLQLLNDLLWANSIVIASTRPVFTLTGVSTLWSPFNVLPGGDLVLSHPLKPLLTSLLFLDVSPLFFFFYVYLEISQVLFDLYFLTNIFCFSFRDGNCELE